MGNLANFSEKRLRDLSYSLLLGEQYPFPRKEGGVSQIRRQIGEAVPPYAGKVIAALIKDILASS